MAESRREAQTVTGIVGSATTAMEGLLRKACHWGVGAGRKSQHRLPGGRGVLKEHKD